MGKDIQTELSVLRTAVRQATEGPMMPTERVAIEQMLHVVELIALKLDEVCLVMSLSAPE